MNAGYRIETTADKFKVIGRYDENVAVHSTRADAEEEIKRCLQEDARTQMARILVDTAIKSYCGMFGTDRQTARAEIAHAASLRD